MLPKQPDDILTPNEHKIVSNHPILYHCTDLNGLKGILEDNFIRGTYYQKCSGDSNELKQSKEIIYKSIERYFKENPAYSNDLLRHVPAWLDLIYDRHYFNGTKRKPAFISSFSIDKTSFPNKPIQLQFDSERLLILMKEYSNFYKPTIHMVAGNVNYTDKTFYQEYVPLIKEIINMIKTFEDAKKRTLVYAWINNLTLNETKTQAIIPDIEAESYAAMLTLPFLYKPETFSTENEFRFGVVSTVPRSEDENYSDYKNKSKDMGMPVPTCYPEIKMPDSDNALHYIKLFKGTAFLSAIIRITYDPNLPASSINTIKDIAAKQQIPIKPKNQFELA